MQITFEYTVNNRTSTVKMILYKKKRKKERTTAVCDLRKHSETVCQHQELNTDKTNSNNFMHIPHLILNRCGGQA